MVASPDLMKTNGNLVRPSPTDSGLLRAQCSRSRVARRLGWTVGQASGPQKAAGCMPLPEAFGLGNLQRSSDPGRLRPLPRRPPECRSRAQKWQVCLFAITCVPSCKILILFKMPIDTPRGVYLIINRAFDWGGQRTASAIQCNITDKHLQIMCFPKVECRNGPQATI